MGELRSRLVNLESNLESRLSNLETNYETRLRTLESGLNSRLRDLEMGYEGRMRGLEKNYESVLVELVGFQRGVAQQDGVVKSLIRCFLGEDSEYYFFPFSSFFFFLWLFLFDNLCSFSPFFIFFLAYCSLHIGFLLRCSRVNANANNS